MLVVAAGDGPLFCGPTPVTTLEFNAYEAGARAVDTLFELINDRSPRARADDPHAHHAARFIRRPIIRTGGTVTPPASQNTIVDPDSPIEGSNTRWPPPI
ncbi:MAG: hypothetical protein ACR2L9_03900 [Solirubrobacteraceae bacterium]